jgi:hypothetical protein
MNQTPQKYIWWNFEFTLIQFLLNDHFARSFSQVKIILQVEWVKNPYIPSIAIRCRQISWGVTSFFWPFAQRGDRKLKKCDFKSIHPISNLFKELSSSYHALQNRVEVHVVQSLTLRLPFCFHAIPHWFLSHNCKLHHACLSLQPARRPMVQRDIGSWEVGYQNFTWILLPFGCYRPLPAECIGQHLGPLLLTFNSYLSGNEGAVFLKQQSH